MKNLWCEISKKDLLNNLQLIKNRTEKKVIAVVKANAYGCGLEGITSIIEPFVDGFAISDIEDAYEIETKKDILILTPVAQDNFYEDIKDNMVLTIDDEADLELLNKERSYRVQVFVDTGMNRFGIKGSKLPRLFSIIKEQYPNIIVDGIYTHLHNTSNTKYTLNQIELFREIVEPYNEIKNIHCLCSSSLLSDELLNRADFTNSVRVGNLLYGYIGQEQGFKAIYSYKCKMLKSFYVCRKSYVGYGNRYRSRRDSKMAVLPVGAIHKLGFIKDIRQNIAYETIKVGYRHFFPRDYISYKGKRVRIVNRPNMDTTTVDITGLEGNLVFEVGLSPILADSSIKKIYID